jgi:hypothetical protein
MNAVLPLAAMSHISSDCLCKDIGRRVGVGGLRSVVASGAH